MSTLVRFNRDPRFWIEISDTDYYRLLMGVELISMSMGKSFSMRFEVPFRADSQPRARITVCIVRVITTPKILTIMIMTVLMIIGYKVTVVLF